jgi:hypothetical protein
MDKLTEHQVFEERRLTDIDRDIKEMRAEITRLSADVSDLVSARKAASFLLSVVKGLGAIAVAVGSVILLLKGGK